MQIAKAIRGDLLKVYLRFSEMQNCDIYLVFEQNI